MYRQLHSLSADNWHIGRYIVKSADIVQLADDRIMTTIGNIGWAEYRYRLIFQTLISFALYREDEEDGADGEGDDDLGEVLVGRRPAVPDPHAQGQGTDQTDNIKQYI